MTTRAPRARGGSGAGRRKLRYAAGSVASAVLGQAVLMVAFGVLRWSAVVANLVAFVAAAMASYHLNRLWVWGRNGPSRFWREVVPFWLLAATGLAASTTAIVAADDRVARVTANHAARTAGVMVASAGVVVVLWLVKFLILDRYVFVAATVPARLPVVDRPLDRIDADAVAAPRRSGGVGH